MHSHIRRVSRTRARPGGRLRARVVVSAAGAVAALVCGGGRALRAADVTSTWRGGTGNWGSPANWNNSNQSNQFPNNGNGGFTYDAVINSGTVTLDQDISVQAFTLASATLTGANDLTTGALLTWTGGTMSGAGVTNANGGLALGPFQVTLTRTLNNAAAGTLGGGGTLFIQSGGVFNNLAAASFEAQGESDIFGGGTPNGVFNNSGSFRKVGVGETQVSAAFNNSGTVAVEGGSLRLAGVGTHTGSFAVSSQALLVLGAGTHSAESSVTGAGSVRFAGGTATFAGTYNVTGGTTFSSGTTTFTPVATVTALGPTLSFTGGSAVFNNPQAISVTALEVDSGSTATFNTGRTVTAQTLSLGGTLGGSDRIDVPGLLTWTGGTMSGTGVTNASGGLALGPNQVTLTRTLNNAAAATLTGNGGLAIQSGGVFNNLAGASFAAQGEADIFGGGSPNGTFNNFGSFNRVGVGETMFSAVFNNRGTVDVKGGALRLATSGTHSGGFVVEPGATLNFSNGTHDLQQGSSVTGGEAGAGAVRFSGATVTVAGAYGVGDTAVSGGSVTFTTPQSLSFTDLEVSSGTATFNTGRAVTAQTLSLGGTLTGSARVDVPGLLTWTGGTMSGTGVTNASGGLDLGSNQVTLTRTLNNAAAATLAGNGGLAIQSGGVFNNLAGASFEVQSDGDIFGGGVPNGVFNNSGSFRKVAAGETFVSAAFNNSGTVNVAAGTLRLSANGTHSSAFAVQSGATLNFSNGTHNFQAGSGVTGAGAVQFGGAATFAGTYNVSGGTTFSSGTTTFTSAATITTLGPTVKFTGGAAVFNNPQAISVTALEVDSGTATFNTVRAVTAQTVSLGGTLGGSDTINVSGPLTWTGGTMSGTGVTNASGGLDLGPNQVTLSGRTLNNAAAATLGGGGTLFIQSGGVFNNLAGASFAAQGEADIFGGGSPNGVFNNSGSFRKVAAGETQFTAAFNNSGAAEINVGTLRLRANGAHSGAFVVQSGATLDFGGGTHDLGAASSVTGAGAVRFSGATATVAGNYGAGNTAVSGGSVTFTRPQALSFTALGVSSGTATFNTGSTVTAQTLSLGGTLTGSARVDVPGLLTWTGGTMSGTGVTNASGGLALGPSQVTLTRTLNNAAAATLTGTGGFAIQSGGVFNNLAAASFEIQSDGDIFGGGSPNGAFNNSGSFRKVAAGETVVGAAFNNNNSGSVNVDTGTLTLSGGGTHTGSFTVAAGATLDFRGGTHDLQQPSSVTGAGTIRFSGANATVAGTYNVGITQVSAGNVAFNSPATTGTLTLTGGRITGNGSLTVTDLVNTGGTFTTGAATVRIDSATLAPGSTTTVETGGTLIITDALDLTGGTVTVAAGGTIVVGNAAQQLRAGLRGVTAALDGEVPELLTFTGPASPTVTLTGHPSNPGRILLGADVTANIPSGTARIAVTGPVPIAGTVDLNAGSRTFTVSDGSNPVDLDVAARLTNGALRKSGPGTLRLTGRSDYAGGTTLSGGTLALTDTAAAGTGPVTFSGGHLSLLNSAADNTYPFALAAAPADSISLDVARAGGAASTARVQSVTLGAALDVSGASGTLVVSGPVTLQADATVNNAAAVTWNGPVGGAFGFTKTLGGTLTLGGATANTYTGTTTVNEGELALGKTGGAAAVPGPLRINGPGTVRLTAPNQIADAAAVTVNAASGAARFELNGHAETVGSLINSGTVVTGAGHLRVGPVSGSGQVTVSAGGALTADYVRQDTLTVAGTAAVRRQAEGGASSAVKSLLIAGAEDAWAGKLDLADTALVVDYPAGGSPLATVVNQLKSGRAGGAWNGNGITSSSAASTPNTSLGYSEAAAVLGASGGTFGGLPADATSVLVRWTVTGDANLNGAVEGSDFALLAGNFGQRGRSWNTGDFNYDAAVDGSDFALLAANFGKVVPGGAGAAGAVLSSEDWSRLEAFGASAGAAVPEPGAAMLLLLAGPGLLRRGRRAERATRRKA